MGTPGAFERLTTLRSAHGGESLRQHWWEMKRKGGVRARREGGTAFVADYLWRYWKSRSSSGSYTYPFTQSRSGSIEFGW